MSRDPGLSLLDVQTILGHAHLSTTQIYLAEDDAEVVTRVCQHLADREKAKDAPPPPVADGYDDEDLEILFGRKS